MLLSRSERGNADPAARPFESPQMTPPPPLDVQSDVDVLAHVGGFLPPSIVVSTCVFTSTNLTLQRDSFGMTDGQNRRTDRQSVALSHCSSSIFDSILVLHFRRHPLYWGAVSNESKVYQDFQLGFISSTLLYFQSIMNYAMNIQGRACMTC